MNISLSLNNTKILLGKYLKRKKIILFQTFFFCKREKYYCKQKNVFLNNKNPPKMMKH